MRWNGSFCPTNGFTDYLHLLEQDAGCSSSLHSTSGLSCVFGFDFSGGRPSKYSLLGAAPIGNRLWCLHHCCILFFEGVTIMAVHSGIEDESARLQIVASTRKVTVPSACKIIGTVGDHNSEQLTFQCPKTIDGHDVMNCALHYIIYQNAAGGKGRVAVKPEQNPDAEDSMVFTWLISSGVTAAAGNISFSVYFVDLEADGVTVAYRWSTTNNGELQVLPNVGFTDSSGSGGGSGDSSGSTGGDSSGDVSDDPPVEDTLGDLPVVTAADNGAFLRVVDGAWAADQLDDAAGVGM